MNNKIITKTTSLALDNEGMPIDFLLKGYRSYLLEGGNSDKKALNTVSKAITQMNYFLKFIVEFRNGLLTKASFNYYTAYLQKQVEIGALTTSQKALRRMYGRRINLEVEKEGYLVWLYENNFYKVIENKKESLLQNEWSKGFEDWLALNSKLTRKTHYGKTLSNIVGLYLEWLNSSTYSNISALSVNKFLREQAHLKISTLNLYLKAIKRFATYYEHTSSDESRHKIALEINGLKKFEDSLQSVNRIGLSNEQIKVLFNKANQKQQLILHLGVNMGLRGSSMLNLKVADINFETKRMEVWLKGKNNTMTLPIPPEVYHFLLEFVETNQLGRQDALLGYKNNNISSLSKYFSDFLYQCDLKEVVKEGELYSISLHNLRHTFAYNSLEKFGLLTTSRLLGHATTQITEQHYLQDKSRDLLNSIYDSSEY
ncbi:site-specific integrase [Flammeovirga sp. EKP202]|uniref:tyrosine-type recombinase/integrase n=1 Tax=Flammeovirga sp. EKP202 TaxID=2770592 RepID=UPI00165EC119|nr:site-specific integrase [Flammeovirga sp. EKP202]MBD0402051.1 site-specific integrase [Flammeovirga sp. EKP202]